MNNNYAGTPLSPEQLQRQLAAQQRQDGNVPVMTTAAGPSHNDGSMSAVSGHPLQASDSLDDIIIQNTHELERRRSVPQPFSAQLPQDDASRRMSMLEFSNHTDDVLQDFQFASLGGSNDMSGGFSNLSIPGQSSAFAPSNMMAMSDPNDFTNLSQDMMSFSNMDLFSGSSLGNQIPADATATDFAMDMNVDNTAFGTAPANPPSGIGLAEEDDLMLVDQPYGNQNVPAAGQKANLALDHSLSPFQQPIAPAMTRDVSNASSLSPRVSGPPQSMPPPSVSAPGVNVPTATSVATTSTAGKPTKNVYSRSGFDMMRALWQVVSRKNPQLQLGAVDMSCAFVVCDVTLNDCPIIYVSDNFQNLTGYSRHEIMGKNCRFLQAPDGNVDAGSRREFVDNNAVHRIKQQIAEGKEIQQSLINYRKGGKPFLNLLTMIPIPWDSDDIRYFIGFQIDLVECPDAITGNENGGVMQVNYMHRDLEQYIWNPPAVSQWEPENGQTLAVDDVSTLLQQFAPNGITSEWHRQSWDKMLLENTDDVVHVLSLKGLFLYLSPSCRRILEYDTADLIGNSLSSICHPSDIVPVTRELKDTAAGGPVNIVFRIRRKHSGFMWFESHGSLFVEQGKGRKCVILVGRKRPVYMLPRGEFEAYGGVGDSEIWTKLSTSGMFLFVSSSIRSLLDLLPQNLVGTSMQVLMRKESRSEFGRSIEKVRKFGKITSCKHEVQNKRGQVLQAETTFFPGDVPEGLKPTFIIAKTRLLKASSRSTNKSSATSPISLASDLGSSVGHPTALGALGHDGAEGIAHGSGDPLGLAAAAPADDNIFDELGTTKTSSWQYELRTMEKVNRMMAEELAMLLANKKRKRRKGSGNMVRDCANCHTRNTPEWRRGPSGNRDLCNSCGLRWAKQTGKVSPRNSSRGGNGDAQSKKSNSPVHSSPLHREVSGDGAMLPADSPEVSGAHTVAVSGGNAAPVAVAHGMTHSNPGAHPPPRSQPLLEGGSGEGGGGMSMSSIREEWETNA